MSMNIKNPEAHRLARRISDLTGETVTGAVTESLRERLDRLEARQSPHGPTLAEQLLDIGRDCAARLPDTVRSVDHGDLLYGPDGLPRSIIDTSALVAILRDEPEAGVYAQAIAAAAERRISAATYVEVAAVIDGARDPVASRRVDELLHVAGIVIEPVTEDQARLARAAYRDFGKGSGHPARLNFGDCFSYALATSTGDALLFKGDDFSHTDVTPAL